ncbi:MAG: OmpA family protein [Candidatus Scalindua sp. AMX11]|nr:MAG: OmpA family protein [Candidatus Scalindua sp.]NOG83209.1 OmpA family protein [Planctomycetota bacterium]RZV77574.1 MAG: OmpA family protein [Candidatus Scalindua sp. SCAELEC01]TDE64547.1 MAG: OmpA family protein [Candidatus Scalindua sp. AMX11]
MNFSLKPVGFVLLSFLFMGFLTGCSELEGLRIANSRQAITIRDQLHEIDKLTDSLKPNGTLSKPHKGTCDRAVNTGNRKELERLAVSIGGGTKLKYSDDGTLIEVPDELLFDSGLAVLKRDANTALEIIADHLRTRSTLNMRIDGRSRLDPVVISQHGWLSNRHLSAERALSVLYYFIEKGSINPQRMVVVGHGSHKPQTHYSVVKDSVKKGRVEFLIYE